MAGAGLVWSVAVVPGPFRVKGLVARFEAFEVLTSTCVDSRLHLGENKLPEVMLVRPARFARVYRKIRNRRARKVNTIGPSAATGRMFIAFFLILFHGRINTTRLRLVRYSTVPAIVDNVSRKVSLPLPQDPKPVLSSFLQEELFVQDARLVRRSEAPASNFCNATGKACFSMHLAL